MEFEHTTELHIFADASTAAYAAVAYAVTRTVEKATSHIVMAKTRVAPMAKQESVARLELSACQLGVISAQKLSTALGISKTEIKFWTDSTTCLYWLHTKELLSAYVANRVCFILDNTQPTQWKHVSTEENPADVPTQGTPLAALASNELWWNGPGFLRQHPVLWKTQPNCIPTTDALSELITLERAIGRYSFVAHTVYAPPPAVQLAIAGLDRLDTPQPGNLMLRIRALERIREKLGKSLADQRMSILELVIHHMQQTELGDLLRKVRLSQPIPKSHRKLDLFVEGNILRVGGRLARTSLFTFAERFPAVLPKKSLIAEHIVMDIHVKTLKHVGGPLHLMNHVQRFFWLFGGRPEITRILKNCHRCRTRLPENPTPQLAPLHYLRTPDSIDGNIRPFLKIGIDLAGPWLTVKPRDTRTRFTPPQERYMIIFVCGNTRAVHLEMAWSKSADSFLQSFDRFTSTRGFPKYITSDNGGNFVAGERQLRQVLDHWFRHWDRFGKPSVVWRFIPPHSPSQGGNYERMIRSVKQAFYKIIPSQQTLLTDEELGTCFKHIERLVNSRPLTTVSADPRDPVALAPADFLIGSRDTVVAGVKDPVRCNLRERWKFLQNLTRRMWQEFMQEYITRLHPREKWPEKENPLKEVQIVVLLKPDCQKGHWPLGVITKTFAGTDGQVQMSVMVRNSRQELVKRGPSGIAPLANCEITES